MIRGLNSRVFLAVVGVVILFGISALAYDNYDDCAGCAWTSFYELNGYKFVKNMPEGTIPEAFENAFIDAANNWNSKTKQIMWLWYNPGPSKRKVYANAIEPIEYGYGDRQLGSDQTTITGCTAALNQIAFWNKSAAWGRTVAAHELGHCWGLGHSTVNSAIMRYGTDSELAKLNGIPQTDDINGLKAHYSFEQ